MPIPVAPPPRSHTPLGRQAVWVVGCRLVGIAATVASNILAARLLGPTEFGTYLLVTTVMALGGMLAMSGLNEAAMRFISESLALGRAALARAYLKRTLVTIGVTSGAAAVAVTAGFALLMLLARHVREPSGLLALVAVGIAVLAWQQLGAEMLRAYSDLRMASLFSGGQTGGPVSNLLFLFGICGSTFVVAQLDANVAVGITIVSLCVTCPLVYTELTRISRKARGSAPPVKLSSEQRRELFVVGGTLLANQLLAFITQQFDIWLAGGLLTHEALGLYGAAKRSLLIAAMPVQMAMLTIVSSIPRLNAQSRDKELERMVRGAATIAAVPALMALGALTLFPRQVLGTVLGGAYAGAETAMVIMSLGHFVLVLSGNPQHVLTMTGRHRAVLVVNFFSAVTLIAVGAVGATFFGAPGLAAGAASSLALQNGVLWWLARRELGIWTHVGWPVWSHHHEEQARRCDVVLPRESPAKHEALLPEPVPSSTV